MAEDKFRLTNPAGVNHIGKDGKPFKGVEPSVTAQAKYSQMMTALKALSTSAFVKEVTLDMPVNSQPDISAEIIVSRMSIFAAAFFDTFRRILSYADGMSIGENEKGIRFTCLISNYWLDENDARKQQERMVSAITEIEKELTPEFEAELKRDWDEMKKE